MTAQIPEKFLALVNADTFTIKRSDVVAIIKSTNTAYEETIARFPFKKATARILVDGAADGTRNGVFDLLRALGIEVVDDD